MQKLKSFNWSGLVSILKCCLLGIVVTLLGIIIFAVVLKFVDVPSLVVSYINDTIKVFSLFVTILCVKKCNDGKLLLKAILSGVIYAVLSFVIFSMMNGGFIFNLTFVYDLLFAIITAIIVSVIVNITFRRKI